ncbi:MAG: uroporphyrinogen decarboxylase family protein [Candidatus Omnitrophota bacterium]
MLAKKVQEKIDLALNFQQSASVPICEFIDNEKVFYYFSHKSNPDIEDKVKAYHGLRVDICWRFEQRRDYRKKGLGEILHSKFLRTHNLKVLSRDELEAEFADFRIQQKLFEPYTYLSMSADGCLSPAYRSLGFERFSQKMYTEPLEIERLIGIFAENLHLRAEEFSKQNLGQIFFIKDCIGYEKGLIFSLDFLKQHWLPKIKDAIEHLKSKNIKVILHSSGNITEALDALIDIGIDGIHPVDIQAGMDINLIKKQYAKSLILFGSVDIYNKQADEIFQLTKNCLNNVFYQGGYFMGTCQGINRKLDLKSVLAFFSSIREFNKTNPNQNEN